MTTITPRTIPLLSASLSAVGIAFCSWVLMTGGDALCVTEGCSLFQDYRIAGYSLWEGGLAFFTVQLLLCLLKLSAAARPVAWAALAADAALLCVMLFTAPCFNCLFAGALIALCYLALLHETAPVPRQGRSLLVIIWTMLFLFNVGGIVRDAAAPWSPVPHEKKTDVSIWFSPSCPACQKLVRQYESIPNAAWYPVAEDATDLRVIKAMTDNLGKGMPLPEAAAKARESVPRPFVEDRSTRLQLLRPGMLLLQLRLWINQAHVLAAGSGRLPFVEFSGLPAFLQEKQPSSSAENERPQQKTTDAESGARPQADPSERDGVAKPAHDAGPIPELPGFGVAGFCGGEDTAPCKEGDTGKPSAPLIDTSGMM